MTNAANHLSRLLSYQGVPFWRDARVLRALVQVAVTIAVVAIVVFAVSNVLSAAKERGLLLGFDFVDDAAGFPIGETVIDYHESNAFICAFWVGILNTLKVALVGVVAATILGVVIGVARLSSNWLVSKLAGVYVEVFRNVPLLIQLFFWYFAVFLKLPVVRESIQLPGPIYLSNRGLFMVWPTPTASFQPWVLFLLAAVVLAVVLRVVLTRRQARTGRPAYPLLASGTVLVLIPAVAWIFLGGSPLVLEAPELGRLNFQGGMRFTPEFAALLLGLVIYTASYIAEVVRAGIQSVQRGQVEAAQALGLSRLQTLRLVVFPQALRVIIPPLISQYLNLTKNSSLAIVIGYPELFTVGKIMINQAGRAVPIFILVMAAYLAMSLTYALIGNFYNRRTRLVER